jgi:Phosphoribosyl transferase (PRTase)/PELOTA RNA binding domain
MKRFSGSYLAEDVQFLLKPIEIENTSIQEKESLIQTGKKHYSEMITKESLPSTRYISLFEQAFAQNQQRMAMDLIQLARKINQQKPKQIILCSLARAGTPIGVLLKRILEHYFQRDCVHYSISIIRDRGIDKNALRYILTKHSDPKSIAFVDGWTGKGIITRELHNSITEFNQQYQTEINSNLYVLNDIAGVAAVTVSFEDYLIPSSLLNATISGLISRSILNSDYIGKNDFHGCLYYADFQAHDLSQWFINEMMKSVAELVNVDHNVLIQQINGINKQQVHQQSTDFINQIKETYQIKNVNLIKPGIGESTRVLLRRLPNLVILKNLESEETRHLVMLANEKKIPIVENSTMPYQATAIIAEHKHD